jgi:hypothetical protein
VVGAPRYPLTPKLTVTCAWSKKVFEPVKDTVCVPLASIMVSVPVLVPLTVGEKVTPMVQLLFAATLVPQVFELTVNGAAVETLVTVRAELPPFLSVTVCAALVVPTVMSANVRLAGVAEALEPVPLKVTTCGLPVAESDMDRVPVMVPVAVGVKITLIVQALLADRELGQLLVWE